MSSFREQHNTLRTGRRAPEGERGLTAAAGAWSGKETTGTRCESPEPLCVWCGREWFVGWDTQLTRGRWWWRHASPARHHLTPCHATWKGRSVSSAARCREERHACKAGIIAAHSKGRSERWSVRREATRVRQRDDALTCSHLGGSSPTTPAPSGESRSVDPSSKHPIVVPLWSRSARRRSGAAGAPEGAMVSRGGGGPHGGRNADGYFQINCPPPPVLPEEVRKCGVGCVRSKVSNFCVK